MRAWRGYVKVVPISNRWDITIDITCTHWNTNLCHTPPKTTEGSQHMTKVNTKEIYHSLVTGVGWAGLVKRAAFMGAQSLCTGAYTCHWHFTFTKMEKHFAKSIKTAHEGIFKYYITGDISKGTLKLASTAPEWQGNTSLTSVLASSLSCT